MKIAHDFEASTGIVGPMFIEFFVKLGLLKLDDVEVQPSDIQEVRNDLQEILGKLPMGTPVFDELNGVLRGLDALCGQPVTSAEEPFTEADFDRLPEKEQQQVIDNMSLSDGYRQPPAWLEAVRASYAHADREMLAAQVYEIVQHLDLGRWSIVSHVPDRPDAAERHREELEKAIWGLSVKNPARQKLIAMSADLL